MNIFILDTEEVVTAITLKNFIATLPYMVNEDRSTYYVKKDLLPLFDKEKGYLSNIVISFNDHTLTLDSEQLTKLQLKLIEEKKTVDLFCRYVQREGLGKYISNQSMDQESLRVELDLREKFNFMFGSIDKSDFTIPREI